MSPRYVRPILMGEIYRSDQYNTPTKIRAVIASIRPGHLSMRPTDIAGTNPEEGLMARWRWWLAALLVLGTLITPSLLTPTTSSAAPLGCGVSGEAYGARASVLGTTTLAKVARVVLPPGGTNGSASASLPIGGSLGAISTSATDTSTPALASATSTATVDGTNLLAGLITATEIKAVANSSTDGVTATNSATGTTFTNLV